MQHGSHHTYQYPKVTPIAAAPAPKPAAAAPAPNGAGGGPAKA